MPSGRQHPDDMVVCIRPVQVFVAVLSIDRITRRAWRDWWRLHR
jgi:hypothetical protein